MRLEDVFLEKKKPQQSMETDLMDPKFFEKKKKEKKEKRKKTSKERLPVDMNLIASKRGFGGQA